jgi:hypothetical protein
MKGSVAREAAESGTRAMPQAMKRRRRPVA